MYVHIFLFVGVMAVEAKQFPIAAVGRIVVVVVVAVMHGQFAQVGDGEFAGAAAADPRVDFQGALAVALGPGVGRLAGIDDDLVETLVIDFAHVLASWREPAVRTPASR